MTVSVCARPPAVQPNRREPRRILVVGSSMHFTGGISFHTVRLANALSHRHAVSAVLMRNLVPRRLYPGHARIGQRLSDLAYEPRVDLYDGVDWYWVPSILGALRTLLRRGPEAVIFHWWTGAVAHTYIVLAAAARLTGARIIFELHEVQDPGEAQLGAAVRYVRVLWRLLNPLVDAFVIHSESDRAVVRARFQTGARPVDVIPVGSYDHYGDLATIAPRRDAPADACNILFFGLIRPYKGLEDLVAAFNSLSPVAASGFWLTVVGETWEGWTKPAALIAESPHRERITFVNSFVPDSELARHLAGADVVVLPYRRGSASGPLHAAMSAGLPVVVTDVGGLREAASGYAGAVFIPPSDPDAIIAGIEQARVLARARFSDPHSWDAVVDLYEGLINRLHGDSLVPKRPLRPQGDTAS